MAIAGVDMMREMGITDSSDSAGPRKTNSKASDPTDESDPEDPMKVPKVPGLVSFFTSGLGRSEWPLQ